MEKKWKEEEKGIEFEGEQMIKLGRRSDGGEMKKEWKRRRKGKGLGMEVSVEGVSKEFDRFKELNNVQMKIK